MLKVGTGAAAGRAKSLNVTFQEIANIAFSRFLQNTSEEFFSTSSPRAVTQLAAQLYKQDDL